MDIQSYSDLKKATQVGWNTFNPNNVLSHVLLPYGFNINLCFRNFRANATLREALIGRRGENDEKIRPTIRSNDGKYTELDVQFRDCDFKVQSTVDNGEQIILVTPTKIGHRPLGMIIEAALMWGKEGIVGKKDGRIFGKFSDKEIEIFTDGNPIELFYTHSTAPYTCVELNRPVAVSTRPCSADEAKKLVDAAKAELIKSFERFGKHAESYSAMSSCLSWDTVYEPEHNRICSEVSRIWSNNWGGYVLFDWDTYFAGLLASMDNENLAYANVIAITEEVTESGFIPNYGAAHDYKTRDRSQPPVGSHTCLTLYKKFGKKWILEYLYDTLLGWNKWFSEHRTTEEGYMCWGSDPYTYHYSDHESADGPVNKPWSVGLESGLDNSQMYDDMPYDYTKHMSVLADTGLMGLYIMDCLSLIEIAKIIGKEDDIPVLEKRAEKVENALETMWSEDFGIYCNKRLDTGELSRAISPTCFYSLWSRKASHEHGERIVKEHFYNPEEFWGQYIIPTTARNHPAFKDNSYWRGRIWAPTNYLSYIAFKNAGFDSVCDDIAVKSEELLLKEWREHGHVHENYNGANGEGCDVWNSDPFYHWGGLLSYISIINDENK